MPERTLWVGAAGSATGFGAIRSVRDVWDGRVRIVAGDINPPHLVAAGALADATVQVPFLANEEAFARTLWESLERHAVDTYMPLLVEEILLAARLREAGRIPGVDVLAPEPEVAALCADKLALARRLAELDLPVPPTSLAGEARWWPEGVVVKARGGEGSRAVEVLTAEDELEAARRRGDGAIAQRRCEPPEITVDAFRSRNGAIFRAVCRERIEVKAGVSTKARVFDHAELGALVREVAEGLGLCGALCVQAMPSPAGGFEVIDVNPRSGGGTRMSAAAGVDVVAATLADAWGEDPAPFVPPLRGETFVVRHYEELVRPAE
jgi:carbamoyl-phosphate synthase large subunit